MIPLKINNKHLYQIMDPEHYDSNWTDAEVITKSIQKQMFPVEVFLTSETYSRDAERTADYELENLTLVNRKAKPEFTWTLIKYTYVQNLFAELNYTYDFMDTDNVIIPQEAPNIAITYYDFVGIRTIQTYLGQTISGTLREYNGELFWENLRIAFPER